MSACPRLDRAADPTDARSPAAASDRSHTPRLRVPAAGRVDRGARWGTAVGVGGELIHPDGLLVQITFEDAEGRTGTESSETVGKPRRGVRYAEPV